MSSEFNIKVHNELTFSNEHSTLGVAAVSGTDTPGKNLTIAAGQGTGTGDGGSIIFQTADGSGSSGSSANSLATAMTITDDGTLDIGSGSLTIDSLGVITNNNGAYFNSLDIGLGSLTIDSLGVITNNNGAYFNSLDIGLGSLTINSDGELIAATNSSIGTLTLENGSITDSSGAISFGDENLSTTGTVGIGTTSPGTLLQLEGDTPYLTLKNSTSENTDGGCESKIIFEDHANYALAQIQGSHDGDADDTKGDLIFSTNNGSSLTEQMRLDSSGNVGIGTDDPTTRLKVVASLDNGNAIAEFDGASTGNNANFISVKNSDGGATAIFGCCPDNLDDGGIGICNSSSSGSGNINFYRQDDGLNNLMTILASGNVGIGTTSPGTLLQLEGDTPYLTLKNSTSENTDGGCESRIIFEDHANNSLAQIQGSHDGDADDTKGDLIFSTNNGSSLTEQMRLDSSGNVGIGTISPDEKLVVDGNLRLPQTYAADGIGKKLLFHSTTGFGISGINCVGGPMGNEQVGSYLNLFTNNTNRISILQGGKVGINTTTPDSVFSIHGDNDGASGHQATLTMRNTTVTNGTENGLWRIFSYVNNNNGYLYFYNSTSPDAVDIVGYLDGPAGNKGALDFTGQHKSLMNKNINTTKVGLIVISTNNYINLDNSIIPNINESLSYCALSNIDNDKRVFGVISDKEDTNTSREYANGNFVSVFSKKNNNEQRLVINSLGEGAIWICNKNGSLDNGDYITSTTVTGYGVKQSDDILHNYTVAKITCDCHFSLTKIVKQKLKVTIDGTSSSIDYDTEGDPEYEDDLDENGNQQMVYPLETRFLQADGTLLTDEADYTTRLGNGEEVYIACFVGCTYHCG